MDPGLIVSLAGMAVSAAAGALSWCFRLNNSHVRMMAQFEATQRLADQISARVADHNAQIAGHDTALVAINRSMTLADERHREITGKLDILPKLEATLEAVGEACKQIVPRHEIDQRFEAARRYEEQLGVNVTVIKKQKTSVEDE